MVFAAIALLLLMLASSYKDLSLWGRQNREVRVYATPSYPIYSVFAQLEMQFKDKTPKNVTPIALDARRVSSPSGKPRIVVMVVGETARAAHFQPDGSDRQTTQDPPTLPGGVSLPE